MRNVKKGRKMRTMKFLNLKWAVFGSKSGRHAVQHFEHVDHILKGI
jgi:hypothetical protein